MLKYIYKLKKQYMKISSSRNTKKAVAISLIALLLAVALASGYYFYRQSNDSKVINKKTETETNTQSKKDFIEKDGAQTGKDNTQTDTSPPKTTEEINESLSIDARRESNNTVTLLTKLYDIPAGTCTVNIKNGSKTLSKNAPVIYQSQYSTCAGFSIAEPDLGTGDWSITLIVTNGESSYTKSIVFTVN